VLRPWPRRDHRRTGRTSRLKERRFMSNPSRRVVSSAGPWRTHRCCHSAHFAGRQLTDRPPAPRPRQLQDRRQAVAGWSGAPVSIPLTPPGSESAGTAPPGLPASRAPFSGRCRPLICTGLWRYHEAPKTDRRSRIGVDAEPADALPREHVLGDLCRTQSRCSGSPGPNGKRLQRAQSVGILPLT